MFYGLHCAFPFHSRAASQGSLGLSGVAFCSGFVGGGLLPFPWGTFALY